MAKCINLGEYNKHYKYMILYIFFKGLSDCIKGFGNKDLYEDLIFFGDDAKKFFYSHEIINTIFGYFGIVLFYIIYRYFDDENDINFTELDYNLVQNKKIYNEYEIYWNAALVSFLWVIQDLLTLKILFNFWTFRIIFAYFIGKKIFNIPIYKHQIFAIYFISIVCSLLLLIELILLILTDENNKFRKNHELIPIGILIGIIYLLIESFSNWKYKWIINLKFTLSNKLFMYYGIIGFIIYSFICIIATLFDCGGGLFDLCNLEKDKIKYLENVTIYFDDLTKENCILMIIYAITFVLKSFFYLLTIKHLTPFHVISMPTIYYFIRNIILGIYTFSKNKKLKKDLIIYILEVSTNFLAFLAFSIFLEFIELNFCLCNYNLRRNIARRSLALDISVDDSMMDNEEEEKKKEDFLQNELSSK